MKAITKRAYEKPVLKKEDKMIFPLTLVNLANRELACRQCSSCHGCR